MNSDGLVEAKSGNTFTDDEVMNNYRKAAAKGILKVMSKMGILTLQRYKGAQVFEAVELAVEIVEKCFTDTTTRIQGTGFEALYMDLKRFHEDAYSESNNEGVSLIRNDGQIHYRTGEEAHLNTPQGMVNLQVSARTNSRDALRDSEVMDDDSEVTDDGYVIFEAERDLVTSRVPGHKDHDLFDDSNIYVADHKIIGAWGSGSFMSFHGNNVVLRSVQLFLGPDGKGAGDEYAAFKEEMDARVDGFADLSLSNYDIPRDETTYHEVCFTVNDLVDLGLYKSSQDADTYVIGFEYLIDQAATKYLHHMVVYGHFSQWNTNPNRCVDWARTTIALWAPGDDTMHFPDGAGLQIGNVPDSFNAITIQYHFDNRKRDRNQVDNGSGVRIYFTEEDTIENKIGMFTLGDANLNLKDKLIGNGKTKHEITCSSTCTSNTFAVVDEVTVVAELHHMHAKGKRLVNEIFSEDGSTILNTATVDYWDFDQSGGL